MKFTVIIPTRDRADTLQWCLKTCISQDYDDFEIIVSDNASLDGTADLVRSFSDKRINYINTGKRLGMSQNWEFALGHARDGYVLFVGDDDGLMPNAIRRAKKLLTENEVDALAWKKASYAWPNHIDPGAQNCLTMSLGRGMAIRDSREMLRRVCDFDPSLGELSYDQLPGLYNSFVPVSAINKARSVAGRFFCSQIPDVYSAIALTSSIRNYVYSERPLSINGASSHSNGTSYMRDPQLAASAKFLSEDNIPFHADLIIAPSIPVITTESVWQVRDHVPGCENYDINVERLFSEARRLSARLPKASLEIVDVALEKVRAAKERDVRSEMSSVGKSMSKPFIWRYIMSRCRSFIFSFTRRFPVSEVNNVYGASIIFQELGTRRHVWWLVINSIFRKLMHRILKTGQ